MTKKNNDSFLSVLDQTTLPKSGTKALERLHRFQNGESIEQIRKADGVTEKTVRDSLNEARHLTRTALEQRVLDLKLQGAEIKEQLRNEVLKEFNTALRKAIKMLLTGMREAAFFDQRSGRVITKKIVDPTMIVAGVEQLRKIGALDEKPSPNTQILNIQQNTRNGVYGGQGEDFEERMRRIRRQQKESIAAAEAEKVVDVESETVEEEEGPEWDF